MFTTDTLFKTKFTGTLLRLCFLLTLPALLIAAPKSISVADINGTAFLDCNGNGIRDNSEVGFDGITVILDGSANSGSPLQTTTTTNGGSYKFTGVSAGTYKITFKLPSGTSKLFFAPKNQGNDPLLDSDVDSTGITTFVFDGYTDLQGLNAGIIDMQGPKITLVNPLINSLNNGDTLTVQCDSLPLMNNSWASTADNSGLKSDLLFSDLILASGNCIAKGFTQLLSCTWTAKDICGNTSVYTIFIKVTDNKAPVIINTPSDTIIYTFKGQTVPTLPNTISAADNCSGNNIGVQYAETQTQNDCGSVTKRTWISVDGCGNTATKTQAVTIVAMQGCISGSTNPADSFKLNLVAGTAKDTLVANMFGTNRIVTAINHELSSGNSSLTSSVSAMIFNGGLSVRFSAVAGFTKPDTIIGTQCGSNTTDCRDFFIFVAPQALQSSAHCFLPNDTSATYKVATCTDKAYFCIMGVNNVDSFKRNYTILEGGQPYTNKISGCSFDSLYSYTYFTVPKMGKGFPYRLDYWNLNGQQYTISSFILMQQLLDSMNVWDPIGHWKIDTSLLVIYGGNSRNSYGQIKVTRIANGSIGYLELNTQYNSNGLNICFNVGGHELIIRNNTTLCQDFVRVVVTCDSITAKKPIAVPDSFSVHRNGSRYFSPLANDKLNGGLRSFSLLTLPKNGNFTYTGVDSIFYQPLKNFCGGDTFRYSVCNEFFLCDTSTITVNVTCDSLPKKPVALSDRYTTKKNTPIIFNPTTNDQINGMLSGITIVSSPKNGTIGFTGTDSLVYTPVLNYCGGTDTLRYRITNTDLLSDTAFVFVTVTCDTAGINPKANNDIVTTQRNLAANINVLKNDVLNGTLVSLSVIKNPTHGTASILNNTVVYSPLLNFCGGSDTLQYKVCNGTGCDSAFVFISVVCDSPSMPKKPVAINDSYTTKKNQSFVFKPTLNDQINGVLSGVSTVTLPLHGAISFMGIDSLIYTPQTGYCGQDTFRYRLTNTDLLSDTAFVFITVTCDTPPPAKPIAVADNATTKKNTSVTINVLLNDTPNGTVTVSINQNPKNGTAVVTNNQVVYTPTTGFCGASDTLRYKICNNFDCDSAFVIITVTCDTTPPPAKPIAVADNAATKKNTPVTVNVLLNDTPNGIVTVSINQNPKNGTAVVTNNQVVYTPATGFCGANDTLRYKVCNAVGCDSALLIVAVSCQDTINPDKPVAVNDSYTTKKNTSIAFKPTNNDNINGTLSGVTIVSGPKHGTINFMGIDSLIYKPDSGFCGGIDTIRYRLVNTKLLADTALIFITVSCDTIQPINPKPIAVADNVTTKKNISVTVNVLANDTPNGLVTVSINQNPKNGTAIIANNQVVYTPTTGFCGANDTLRYKICNSVGCDSAFVIVAVTCDTPPPPTLKPIAVPDNATTKKNTPVTVNVLANDTPNGVVTVTTSINPKNGTAVVANNQVMYSPNTGFCGFDTMRYKECNTGGCDSATLIVTVTCDTVVPPSNKKPIAITDYYTIKKNTTLNFAPTKNDILNGTLLSLSITKSAKHGLLGYGSTPDLLIYIPNRDYCGNDTLQYLVCNNSNLCDTASIFINISCDTTLKPVAANDAYVTFKNKSFGFKPTANDILNGTLSSLSTVAAPKHGSIAFFGDSILYAPALNYCGLDTFQYKVCNDKNLCDSAFVFITVNCDSIVTTPKKPVAVNDTVNTKKNTPVHFKPTSNDQINGTFSGMSFVKLPLHGIVGFIGTDSVMYTPNANYCGADTLTYRITNTDLLSDTAIVFINIACDSSALPVAVNDSVTTRKNTPIRIRILDNDTLNGTLQSIFITMSPILGTAVFGNDNVITYTPDSCGFVDSLKYRICNINGCSIATVKIRVLCDTVNPVTNRKPKAVNDIANTNKGMKIQIPVTANDSLFGIPVDSVTIVNKPNHGVASVDANKNVVYIPDTAYCNKSDTMRYAVCNKNGCDTAQVYILIYCDTTKNPTQTPLAVMDTVSTQKGIGVLINVTANDSLRGADTFRIKTNPIHGMAQFDSLHRVKYQPDTAYCGRDTFTYEICNRFGCSAAPVIVNINCSSTSIADTLPRAKNDTVTVVLNHNIDIPVLNNDTLRGATLISTPTMQPHNGKVTTNTSGGFNYTPNANYFGIDSFQYSVCNRYGCSTAWVIIAVDEGDSIIVYNAFSPNGDFVNDQLQIAGIDKFQDNQVVIFNRWGEQVYNVKGYTNANGWDGAWEHKMVPDGTYFYFIIINKPDKTQQKYTGYLQVQR